MVRRQRKTCRWPADLLKGLLLQGLLIPAGHAAMNPDAALPALLADGNGHSPIPGISDLYLDVTLNGTHIGLAHFGYRDGQLWASQATLHELGFALPAGSADPARLDSLQGLKASYDASQQTLNLTAPLQLLKLGTTMLSTAANQRPTPSVSPGALLNYNLYGTYGTHGTSSLSAFAELRAFNAAGVFSTTSLTQDNHADDGTSQSRSVRLDTNWSMSFPQHLLTLRFGDTLTDALSWSRSTRIGGVQFGTNFGLQPYLVTAPLPAFIGSATMPSSIDLYVNGLRQYSGQVPTGPFQLSTIPNINGAGNAQVVLTNALGQTTTLNFSLYGENQLLRKGLSDWSVELGKVRENYGVDSFDYGNDAVGSGTWRYGVSNNFTAEAHAELTSGLSDAGVGGIWLLGERGGVLSASLARSAYHGQSGEQYSLGYNWSNERFNAGFNSTRTHGDYRDLGTLYGSVMPRISTQGYLSYNFNRVGNFGVSYIKLAIPQQAAQRYGSAYWYKSLGRWAMLNLSVNQDLDNSRNRTAFAIITLALDHNISVSGSLQRENGRTGLALNATQSLPSQGGLGWRASLSQGDGQNGGQGELDYLGRYGQVQAGGYDIGGTRYGYGGAMGSLVLMGGDLFAARQINTGFAVVSTEGVAGVPVSLQNNPIGTTDSKGMLLVTPLNAYQNNKLSIDPMSLPADTRIDRVNMDATPTDRAGTLVKFGIVPVRAASVILMDEAGKPLPVGSSVQLHGHAGEPALVGFDGAVYLDTLDTHNELDVTTPTGACHANFDYRKQSGGIPQIGPLSCRKVKP
ncbi:fimbrial assembly protein [Rhodanobacter sp. B05]|nr:fimbrial assembly protein [Rhodanobacter sp. B05]